MRRWIRSLLKHWYWMPVWILTVVILGFVTVRAESHWPLGSERFFYPLRVVSDMWWWHGSRLLYAAVRACLWGTPIVALIWLAWFFLVETYPYDSRLDRIAKAIRVYIVFFFIALMGLFFLSPVPAEPQRIASLRTATYQYYLDMRTVYSLQFLYLYECDLNSIVCDPVFRDTGWANKWSNLELVIQDGRVAIREAGAVVYTR